MRHLKIWGMRCALVTATARAQRATPAPLARGEVGLGQAVASNTSCQKLYLRGLEASELCASPPYGLEAAEINFEFNRKAFAKVQLHARVRAWSFKVHGVWEEEFILTPTHSHALPPTPTHSQSRGFLYRM